MFLRCNRRRAATGYPVGSGTSAFAAKPFVPTELKKMSRV